ncbi:MAG: sulfatase-like hydrolase/transferase, partial [Pirellulaceae bacterium]
MNGRRFWLLVAIAWIAPQGWTLSAAERPNFLFIYTDDQRWDAVGAVQQEQGEAARFPWFQTPNLDRLAGEGVRFRNAFVVSSLCAPSRAAFLTGKYNHHNGVVNNHTPFPVDAVTWPSLLRGAGYKTAYVGKWHMGGQTGKRPGFDYSASFVGQGRYVDCPFEIDGKATPTKGWVDDVSTDFAIEFLKSHREESFASIVGFKSAHGPFDPPPRLAEKYAGKEAKKVPNYDLPAIYKGKFDGGRPAPAKGKKGGKKAKAAPAAIDGPSKMRGYFGCLAGVDENVGRLLDTLDELKLADNTVVVFTSDNGFYLGEHNLGDKRSAYEESLRIPLLLRYPRLGAAAKGKL